MLEKHYTIFHYQLQIKRAALSQFIKVAQLMAHRICINTDCFLHIFMHFSYMVTLLLIKKIPVQVPYKGIFTLPGTQIGRIKAQWNKEQANDLIDLTVFTI